MPNNLNIPSDGYVHSISEKGSPVKPKLKNVTNLKADNGNLNPNLRQRVFEVEVIESQIMQILRICVGSDSMSLVEQIKGGIKPPFICWS